MKNLIIFDFFGVVSHELAPTWFKSHFKTEESKALKDKYFKNGDLGEYDIYELFKMMAKDLNLDYNTIITEIKSYAKLNYELIDFIDELRKKYDVVLLSNAVRGIYELFFPELDLNAHFDKLFVSCNYGLIKPNLDFYKLVVDSYDEKFDQVIMIDDSYNNVKDLDKINIKGIQFINNQDLFKKLEALGIKK